MSEKKQISPALRIELRAIAAFTNWYELGQQAAEQGANPGSFLKTVLSCIAPPTYEERTAFYKGYHDQPGVEGRSEVPF